MTIEAIAALSSAGSAAGSQSLTGGARMVDLMPSGGAGKADSASPQLEVRFRSAMHRNEPAVAPVTATDMSSPLRGVFNAVDQVNVQARSVSDYAKTAEASGGQLTPGEIVQLTMKCQEFMFQCQLTSNIANRSSDGVQQLFRQQG